VLPTPSIDDPESHAFRPSRVGVPLTGMPDRMGYGSSDEDIRESGAGILEFSTAKAGLDITPANYDFQMREDKKRGGAGLSNLAGNNNDNSIDN
jgi:hypothetical protein